jgi:serine/threonine protein phosphatase PrpC
MGVSFHGIFTNCYHFIKDKLSSLTPLQRKVALVALAYLSCAMIGYFLYRCCFQARRIYTPQSNWPLVEGDCGTPAPRSRDEGNRAVGVPESLQQAANLTEECISVRKASANSPDLDECKPLVEKAHAEDQHLKKARQQDIEKRLEKNCKFACEQQEGEITKKFKIKLDDIPEEYHKKPLITEEKIMNGRKVAIASCQGRRKAMEDESLVTEISFSAGSQVHQAEIFAIFDGHGGGKASKYAQKYLALYLKKAFEEHNPDALSDVGIWDALKDCFKQLDADYQGNDGTTAIVAICLGDRMWVANVGDSRAILVQNEKTIQASEDAKPGIARYKKTIEEKLGGFVLRTYVCTGCFRVNGRLSVARAIGDKSLLGKDGKCCISPNLKITCYSLKDFQGGYLVLACDGLYDVATTDEVGQAIKQMIDQGISTGKMALHLVHGALLNNSSDNVSVMVAEL